MVEIKSKVRVWCIGSDRTEFFAAHSEEEMRQYYTRMVGKSQAEEDFAEYFTEVPEAVLDVEIELDDDGKKLMTTWRKQADSATIIPTQISTGYN